MKAVVQSLGNTYSKLTVHDYGRRMMLAETKQSALINAGPVCAVKLVLDLQAKLVALQLEAVHRTHSACSPYCSNQYERTYGQGENDSNLDEAEKKNDRSRPRAQLGL